MNWIRSRFLHFLRRITYITFIIIFLPIIFFIVIIIRDRGLYDLPNKISLNNLAKIINYEKTPFIYIQKSGTYLGNIPSLDTPFFLGNITKIYTATLIFQLHEEGQLNLDDSITQYFRHNALPFDKKITIKHLLSHRSGLLDQNLISKNAKIFKQQNHTFTLEELIKDYTIYDPELVGIAHPSDTGYYILGMIIEQVTKKTFEEVLYFRIIDRLNLKSTCIYLYDLDCHPVRGYVNLELIGLGEGYRPLTNHQAFVTSTFSAGYLAASAHDLQTFIKHLINSTFFEFALMEEGFHREEERSIDEKKVKGRYGYGLVDFGKNRYGIQGETLDSSIQMIIEKDSRDVYLYYFGEPGLVQ